MNLHSKCIVSNQLFIIWFYFLNITNYKIQFFPMVNIQDNPLYYAAIGGIIVGIATSLNYALRGTVTGVSGIVYGTVNLDKNQMPKNIAIIGGMLIAGGIFFDIFGYGRYNNFQPFGPKDDIASMTSFIGYGVAGFLVGFGTKLSNGCTSGHGLCGIARLSIRSIVAVCTFLLTGMAIATIGYYEGGLGALTDQSLNPIINYQHLASANVSIVIGVLLPFIGLYMRFNSFENSQNVKNASGAQQIQHVQIAQPQMQTVGKQNKPKQNQGQKHQTKQSIVLDQLIVFSVGLLFGVGLLVAGMVRRSNVIMFLSLGKDWNPSLIFVLGCGLILNLVVFNYFIRVRKSPIFGQKLFNPQLFLIDWKLILGAMCFGLGWGIGGLCPGPAIMQFPIFTVPVHCIWLPFMIIGQLIANLISQIDFSQRLSPTQASKGDKIINQIELKTNPSKQKHVDDLPSNIKIYQDNQDKISRILHPQIRVQQGSDHNLLGLSIHRNQQKAISSKSQNVKQVKQAMQLIVGSGKYHFEQNDQAQEIKISQKS